MKKISKEVILLNKKEGETPLQALEFFRFKNKKYKDIKMTYAGRLDPMASGLLLLLAGDATKQKEKYLKLVKEYKFSVLFGFATDTYDILGKVTSSVVLTSNRIDLEKEIKQNIKYFTGKFAQSYPMYSSKTVDGKPLFAYAREGRAVKSPKHEVDVKRLKFLKIRKISANKLLENIEYKVKKVKGDFRQKEILKLWRELIRSGNSKFRRIPPPFGRNLPRSKFTIPTSYFFVGDFEIKCGSGTYVRGIANSLGEKIGIPALAFSIKRTRIGQFANI